MGNYSDRHFQGVDEINKHLEVDRTPEGQKEMERKAIAGECGMPGCTKPVYSVGLCRFHLEGE